MAVELGGELIDMSQAVSAAGCQVMYGDFEGLGVIPVLVLMNEEGTALAYLPLDQEWGPRLAMDIINSLRTLATGHG